MATFSVRSLGCKVSHTDAHAVREALLAGRAMARSTAAADVAVVNTCCVTHEAARKSRHAAARAARTHARVRDRLRREPRRRRVRGPAANVAVVATAETTAADRRGRRRRDRVRPGRRAARPDARVREDPGRLQLLVRVLRDPARARRTRSRRAEAVLAEIRRRVAQGHREIVLTGVNLGSSATAPPASGCRASCARSARCRGVERLRLSSIEVNHVDADLVAALRETPMVGRHLHVPLQSGDDGVLRAMGAPLHRGHVPPQARAARRLQPHRGRDRRLPGRGRAAFERRSRRSSARG